jgi:hypothetical protein
MLMYSFVLRTTTDTRTARLFCLNRWEN